MNRLHGLRDTLLVQCLPAEAGQALRLADRRGAGVVVTGSVRDVGALAASSGGRPLLVDAGRYSGGSRSPASAEFDPTWLARQREAGLLVLTDSGYTARHDETGMLSILHRTADLGDAVGVLALDTWWLDPRGGLDRLLGHVRRIGVPIAVALEHREDPLGVARTLHGMLALLDTGVPVIQLRCDVSGLGLLCHGAWAAAVGTRTRLRHVHPVVERTGSGPTRRPTVATVVRECLTYIGIGSIALAVQADPEDSLWQACTCLTCKAQQLDWISMLPDRAAQERAASGHALEILFDLRDHLTATPDRADRQLSWRAHCSAALARYDEIEGVHLAWKRPQSLRHWCKLRVPTPART